MILTMDPTDVPHDTSVTDRIIWQTRLKLNGTVPKTMFFYKTNKLENKKTMKESPIDKKND